MKNPKIGMLGAGNMALALGRGLIAAGVVNSERLVASDTHPAAREAIGQALGIETFSDNAALVRGLDVLLVAVKPQVVATALATARAKLEPHTLVISIAAGVTLAALERDLPEGSRVIRAMPNTPALVRAGATAIAPGTHATSDDMSLAQAVFDAVGVTVSVEESQLDAVTGLSGSGPAYVMLAIEALADGGVRSGLPRQTALLLATHTVLGAARLVAETGAHPATLKDQVTSPGGTTIAGVHALETGGFRAALMDAVSAATARSRELGKSG